MEIPGTGHQDAPLAEPIYRMPYRDLSGGGGTATDVISSS